MAVETNTEPTFEIDDAIEILNRAQALQDRISVDELVRASAPLDLSLTHIHDLAAEMKIEPQYIEKALRLYRPSIEEQEVRAGNRVVGKTEIHFWRYNRMSGQNTAVLKFDQEKLMSITYVSK